jgi:hypothetical protein
LLLSGADGLQNSNRILFPISNNVNTSQQENHIRPSQCCSDCVIETLHCFGKLAGGARVGMRCQLAQTRLQVHFNQAKKTQIRNRAHGRTQETSEFIFKKMNGQGNTAHKKYSTMKKNIEHQTTTQTDTNKPSALR